MTAPKFYYPFKPYHVTQYWGEINPKYAAQFDDPNFKKHNGEDANVGRVGNISYQTRFPVYCPADGLRVSEVAFYPKGGGHQIGLVSKQKHDIAGIDCYYSIILCHAAKILVPVGYEPKLGELLMMADNSGYSTGPHVHWGMYRLDDNFQKIDKNEMTGSFNPRIFFTGEYAIDKAGVDLWVRNGIKLALYYTGG